MRTDSCEALSSSPWKHLKGIKRILYLSFITEPTSMNSTALGIGSVKSLAASKHMQSFCFRSCDFNFSHIPAAFNVVFSPPSVSLHCHLWSRWERKALYESEGNATVLGSGCTNHKGTPHCPSLSHNTQPWQSQQNMMNWATAGLSPCSFPVLRHQQASTAFSLPLLVFPGSFYSFG